MTPAERVKRIEDEASGVYAQYGVTMRDREFLAGAKRRSSLSDTQEKWLRDIETRVFGEEAEEE